MLGVAVDLVAADARKRALPGATESGTFATF
jgi:hypothetical protein